jgi:hypothetical protein
MAYQMGAMRDHADERDMSDLPEHLQRHMVLQRFSTWPLRDVRLLVGGPRQSDQANVVLGGWIGKRFISLAMLMRADTSRSGGPWEVTSPHFAFLGCISEYATC